MRFCSTAFAVLLLATTTWSSAGESAPATAALPVIGQAPARYQVDLGWAKVDPAVAPVINSHAIAEGRDGLLYLVTDHPQNAFLVFRKNGTFVRAFGKGLEGGHGLDIFEHEGEEYLLHVDCGWHFAAEGWKPSAGNGRVTLLKTDGTIVRALPTPQELGLGDRFGKRFMPCDVAVTAQRTILIADGYASNRILELTMTGELVRQWGGGEAGLHNAHGISIDTSDPARTLVWVPSRDQNMLKAFTLTGELVESIELPGSYAGQVFIRGQRMYTAVCWSKKDGKGDRVARSGYLLVIDRATRRVISAPGGTAPIYADGKLQPINQAEAIFRHPHDLYVDSDGAIYLGEWNADRRYPAKLTPVP